MLFGLLCAIVVYKRSRRYKTYFPEFERLYFKVGGFFRTKRAEKRLIKAILLSVQKRADKTGQRFLSGGHPGKTDSWLM